MMGRRPDGRRVPELSRVRRFMPAVSPRRNDSLVYFTQHLEAENALQFVEARNREGATAPARRNAPVGQNEPAGEPMSFFHLVLRAIARMLMERPRLNRFVAGGRLWQRDGVWISFSMKKAMSEEGAVTTVKRRFPAEESLDEMVAALRGEIRMGRSDHRSASDREMDLLLSLPPALIRLAVGLARRADALGMLPRRMIDADPLFASVFVANLGSVGLDAGYHHLWEWGNIPMMCVVGRVARGPAGRRVVDFKWSFDERVEDGLYCARSLERLRALLADPESLA